MSYSDKTFVGHPPRRFGTVLCSRCKSFLFYIIIIIGGNIIELICGIVCESERVDGTACSSRSGLNAMSRPCTFVWLGSGLSAILVVALMIPAQLFNQGDAHRMHRQLRGSWKGGDPQGTAPQGPEGFFFNFFFNFFANPNCLKYFFLKKCSKWKKNARIR